MLQKVSKIKTMSPKAGIRHCPRNKIIHLRVLEELHALAMTALLLIIDAKWISVQRAQLYQQKQCGGPMTLSITVIEAVHMAVSCPAVLLVRRW